MSGSPYSPFTVTVKGLVLTEFILYTAERGVMLYGLIIIFPFSILLYVLLLLQDNRNKK